MNKKLLTIVGVAAFVGIGYYLWKSSKPKDTTPTKNDVPTSEDTSTPPPPPPSTPLPARLLSQITCAADEVEEAIPCLIAPCPSMCVKKKGFVGGTGSFFNPIRGRSQDTSF
jgi:hypothetical protein